MPDPAAGQPVRRRRRRSRWRRAKRQVRRFVPALAGLAFVVAGAFAVLAAASWQQTRSAERALTTLRSQLELLVANPQSLDSAVGRNAALAQLAAASTTAADLSQQVHHAMSLRIVHWVPVVGQQRDGLVQLVDDVDHAIDLGQRVLQQVSGLSDQTKLVNGAFPIGTIGQLETVTAGAAREIDGLVRPAGSLWGPLGSSRRKLDDVITSTSLRLSKVATALDGAQRFLGPGRHTYFLALENNAEMRDRGMVLSYAEVTFNDGTIQFGRHGSVDEIELSRPAPTPIPAGTAAAFGFMNPTQIWQSASPGADFAWSARAMSDMYQQVKGLATDGVIALDVPALAALLQVTGPIQVPGISVPLTNANAATVLLHDLYDNFGPSLEQQILRHGRLDEVATAVIARIRQGNLDPVALAVALGKQAAGLHLRLWSRDAEAEHSFERVGLAGGVALADADRTFHVAVENRASNKLDYYLQVSTTAHVLVTKKGDAVVTSDVLLRNDAPAGAPASAQLGPDPYGTTGHPGDYLAWVLQWGPAGSQPAGIAEGGLNLQQAVVLVPAGQSRTVRFVTTVYRAVRGDRLTLRFVPQPRLVPEQLAVSVEGLKTGPKRWAGALDHTEVLAW